MERKRILVVDDEANLVTLLTELLERAGYEVKGTTNPVEGLKLASEWQPDLISLDVSMPVLDGYEFLAQLHRFEIQTRVIILTFETATDNVIRFIKGGACDYLTKPFSPVELKQRIAKALLLEGCLNSDIPNAPPIFGRLAEKSKLGTEGLIAHMHPALTQPIQILDDGHIDLAIFEAFKIVEERVRMHSNLSTDDFGMDLISKALKKSAPILRVSSNENEQDAAHALFRGAIGYFKNPRSHRTVKETALERAVESLAFASLLLHTLERSEPQKDVAIQDT